jgi:regulatory protein
MIVTSITQQVKNPDRANIFVDGKYSFSLTLNELVKEKLKKGLALSEVRLASLKKLSEEGKLRMKVLNWLLLRPHSERELRDYLYRKKTDRQLAQKLIQDFQDKNYQNDREFARWWYEQRSAGNRSDRFIRSELMKKGVDREIIEETIRSHAEQDEGNEAERLRAVIAKKGRLSRYQADQTKFIQYLLRQGFNYDDIKRELGI